MLEKRGGGADGPKYPRGGINGVRDETLSLVDEAFIRGGRAHVVVWPPLSILDKQSQCLAINCTVDSKNTEKSKLYST